MLKKISKKGREKAKLALRGRRSKEAALALYRHSAALGHKWRACLRFLVAKQLGAEFDAEDLAYQAASWGTLPDATKDKVRRDVDQFFNIPQRGLSRG